MTVPGGVGFVRPHDPLHKGVAHNIAVGEVNESNAFNLRKKG